MNALLTRWFRHEAGDTSRVFALMLLGAVLQAGLAMGQSAADSLFLAHVGADRLPVIYVTMPLIMVLYIPVYSYLFGRFGVDRVFDLTLALLVAGGLGCYWALTEGSGQLPYYAAKCYSALWYVGLYTLFWNFVDGHFDLGKAKRLFGLLAAGPAAGAICGGEIVNRLADDIPVPAFFALWSGLAVLAWPILLVIRRRHPPPAVDRDEAAPRPALRDTLRQIAASRFVVVLIAVLCATLITATICEYQYLGIFAQTADESTLASLFGQLYSGVNVFNLCVSLFVFNRLVLRIGVRNVALIQPVVFLVVFALLLAHGGFGSALLGFIAFQGIMTAIDYNNINLLFNGLPEQNRSQVRTFVEGLCEPLATATAGIFLFFVAPRLTPGDLSAIGLACAAVMLLLVLLMRVDYARAMVANVRRSWLDFTRPPVTATGLADPDLALLEQRVRAPRAGEQLLALRLLCAADPVRALGRGQTFPDTTAGRPPPGRDAVATLLATRHPAVLLEALRWSETQGEALPSDLLAELGRHQLVPADLAAARLDAPDPAERATAAALLWRSSRLAHGDQALRTVETLLQADGASTLAGIRALGLMGEPRYIPTLLPCLQSPSPSVRLEALRALAELVDRDSTRVVPPLLDLLATGVPAEEREIILRLVGRIADSTSLPLLLALADRLPPHERRAVERLVIDFGPRAVPALVSIAQSQHSPLCARLLAVRALSRLAFPQLEAMAPALIESAIANAYRLAALAAALAQAPARGPGLALLAQIYGQLPRFALEMVLELLSVTGRLPGHDSIVTALRHGSARERGYAIENIEQGAGRQLFARLEPLLDGRPAAEIARLGRTFGHAAPASVDLAIARSLDVPFPLEAAAALHALHEIQPDAAAVAALRSLRAHPHPLLHETAHLLLHRPAAADTGAYTPVERVHLAASCDFFRSWDVAPLEFVGKQARELRWPAGATLPPLAGPDAGIHVIAAGRFLAGPAAGAPSFGAGSTLGHETLLGQAAPAPVIAATAGRTLFIPHAVVLDCARIYPEVALELLRRKLAPSPA